MRQCDRQKVHAAERRGAAGGTRRNEKDHGEVSAAAVRARTGGTRHDDRGDKPNAGDGTPGGWEWIIKIE